jgi:hypothetical protein
MCEMMSLDFNCRGINVVPFRKKIPGDFLLNENYDDQCTSICCMKYFECDDDD